MAGWLIWLVPALAAWVTEGDRKNETADAAKNSRAANKKPAESPKPEAQTAKAAQRRPS